MMLAAYEMHGRVLHSIAAGLRDPSIVRQLGPIEPPITASLTEQILTNRPFCAAAFG